MSEGVFDKCIVTVECRTCGFLNSRTVGWTKRNTTTECDRCEAIFQLYKPDNSSVETEVSAVISNLRAALVTQVPDEEPVPQRRRFWRRS